MHQRILNIALICITIAVTAVFFKIRTVESNPIHGDALGYYIYLPSAFIYHNIPDMGETTEHLDIPPNVYSELRKKDNKTPQGHTLNQYTYGIALLETPFFFIAHAYEHLNGRQANGYSGTYALLLKISALFYGLLGMWLVYRILIKYFSPGISLLSTVLVLLCTNLFWFVAYEPGMSHTPLFCLYALLILLSIRLYEKPRTGIFIAIALTAGMITIIRPTDILCLLIPLLYNVYNLQTLRERITFLRGHMPQIAISAVVFVLPAIPQLFYWKAVTGSYLFYSYGAQSFDWRHPHIIEGLFYFRNGWLPYSPIMLFAIAGFFLSSDIKKWKWSIAILFSIYVYVIYSWYCYNYINGLGSRPMINIYPLLAIPLAAFIKIVSRQRGWVKMTFAVVCIFFAAANVSYSNQQAKGMLFSEESNMQYNIQILFRNRMRYKDLVVNDLGIWQPDSNKLEYIMTATGADYEDSVSEHYVHDAAAGSKYVYHMTPDEEYLGVPSIIYDHEKYKDVKWLRYRGRFMYTHPLTDRYYKHYLRLVVDEKGFENTLEIENKTGNWRDTTVKDINLEHYEPNRWSYIYFYAPMPKNLKDGDMIKAFIWNRGKGDIYADDMYVDMYR